MAKSNNQTYVAGVGITPFTKPGTSNLNYHELGAKASEFALQDAGLSYSQVDGVVASYCYGDPCCGQRAVYHLGLSGVPVFNVNNNCSSASSALYLARSLVRSGLHKCVLAVGFEQMERGLLSSRYPDKPSPVQRHVDHMVDDLGAQPGVVRPGMNDMTSDVIKMFAMAAREYCHLYPHTPPRVWLDITYKNRRHGAQNPNASVTRGKQPPNLEDLARAPTLSHPITSAMATPTADGGAAALVCSSDFCREQYGADYHSTLVEIRAQQVVTDLVSSFGSRYLDVCGFDMSRRAADLVYGESGLSARDVDVLEVHDCFSCNELFMYEALGLCKPGDAHALVRDAEWIRNRSGGEVCLQGKRWVVNPSGGLESKGHPIGATGLAQCHELVSQLVGNAGLRQTPGARTGLQHNFGIGGAAVCTMYTRGARNGRAKL